MSNEFERSECCAQPLASHTRHPGDLFRGSVREFAEGELRPRVEEMEEHGKLDPAHKGKLGAEVFHEAGQAAARLCAINLLAQAKAVLGSLDRVKRCVRLGGFINCRPDFNALPAVMNGASDLMVAVLGEHGRHARTTIGVAQLPLDCAVEVEALFEIA